MGTRLTVQEVKDTGIIPKDTIIVIEVDKIEERHVPGRNGADGWDKLEFKFIIRELPSSLAEYPEYQELLGLPIWGSVSKKLTEHPDNKLRQWAEALLGLELNVGFELDTDMLKGRRARGQVTHYTKRDGTTQHQVSALLPAAPVSASVPGYAQSGGISHSAPGQPVAPSPMLDAARAATAAPAYPAYDEPPF